MSLNMPPSFVSVDEKRGKVTVAFLTSWYSEARCDKCLRFKKRAQFVHRTRTIAYCELIEADEACEVTGIHHVGE
ncbi:MAG: hypothetical protein KAX31_05485 [Thermoplasmata archaeon]|nr:hypothetical protein [Thermoplasmata archaeon]